MSENIFFAAFFFPCAAAVLVYFVKYLSGVLQARGRLAQEDAYRELAAQAVASQTQLAATLAAQGAALAEIQARLVKLEAILKEVE